MMTTPANIVALLQRVRPRKREKWDDVPMAVIALLAATCSLEALFYSAVMKDAGLPFLELANKAPFSEWSDTAFLCCLALTALIASQVAIWSFAAAGLVKILQKRVFGV